MADFVSSRPRRAMPRRAAAIAPPNRLRLTRRSRCGPQAHSEESDAGCSRQVRGLSRRSVEHEVLMDANAKKTALRMIPYGLYVLTAQDADGTVAAATVNWSAGVVSPPLVVVGAKADSGAYAVYQGRERLCPQHSRQGPTGRGSLFFKPAVRRRRRRINRDVLPWQHGRAHPRVGAGVRGMSPDEHGRDRRPLGLRRRGRRRGRRRRDRRPTGRRDALAERPRREDLLRRLTARRGGRRGDADAGLGRRHVRRHPPVHLEQPPPRSHRRGNRRAGLPRALLRSRSRSWRG